MSLSNHKKIAAPTPPEIVPVARHAARTVVPTPKECVFGNGALKSKSASPLFTIEFDEHQEDIRKHWSLFVEEFSDLSGGTLAAGSDADFAIHLALEALPESSPEAYRLEIDRSITIKANAIPGLLYGFATLRQLLLGNPGAPLEIPRCRIVDYPDIPHRCAARWLIELEGSRMMYDWGDGRAGMLERYRHKIDFCMRHKINMAFFDGFEWKTDKYPEYVDDVRELNRYAQMRNVKLVFGGHGIGFGGFPGHTLEGAKGLGGYNRVSYPDGGIYSCGRVPDVDFDPFRPSITSDAMRNGTCRSNEALNDLKRAELADYVRRIEPGVLYIHNEDIAAYAEFEQMWMNRCPDCRKRWPSDTIASREGAAGAIAHGMNCLYEGIASVKNEATGYDGSRDAVVIFASPTYGTIHDDDPTWDSIGDFWTAVSRELRHTSRIMLCMREQFFRRDGGTLRIRELARRLTTEGGGHGLFVFAVGGADGYTNSALFSAASRLNHYYEGAESVFNFNGGLFAAPQEIYNAEYTWNLRSPHGVDEADDYAQAIALYRRRSAALEYPGEDPLFERTCQLCYGDAAPEMLAFYRLRDEHNNFPATLLFRLLHQLFKKPFSQHDHALQQQRWAGVEKQTGEAIRLVRAALRHDLPRPEVRGELEHLLGCLNFGVRVSGILSDLFAPGPDGEALKARLHGLREFVLANYDHDFTSPFEGEMNLWNRYLAGILALAGQIDDGPNAPASKSP